MNYNRKTNMIFAILAAVAGFFYSIADYLLEYMPYASGELDQYGVVEAAWVDMSSGRFAVSLAMSAVLTPLFVAGYICIYKQIKESAPKLSKAFVMVALVGGLSDFFIHAILCIMPVTFKSAYTLVGQEAAVKIMEDMTASYLVPFFCYFAFIFAGYVLWFVYAFGKKSIYPKWYAVVLLVAVIVQLICSASFSLQVFTIGVFSRLEMTFFLIAAVTEYKLMKSVK